MVALISLIVATQLSTPPQSIELSDSTSRPIAQMVHTKWSEKDGAPPGIYALGQTGDGYLWVGTRTSLFRFDGVRFAEHTPTGRAQPVTKILSARDGSAWIVWTNGSLSHLRNGQFETYGARQGLLSAQSIAESPQGMVVAGTPKGLFKLSNGTWTNVSKAWAFPETPTLGVWFDRDGTLWAQTPDRFMYLPAGGTQFVDPGISLYRTATKTEFAQTNDGTVWTSEFYRSAHSLRKAGDAQPSSQVKVGGWTLLVDRRGSLWIGSYGDGLRRVLDPARIAHRQVEEFGNEAEQFTMKDGLQSNLLLTLFEDRDGGVWVGSDRGLDRFTNGAILPLSTPGGTRYRSVFALRDSTVWVFASGHLSATHITRQGFDVIRDSVGTTNLFQDSSGAVWNASERWFRRYADGHFRFVQPQPDTSELFLDDIVVDNAGTIWLHDQHLGLVRRQGLDMVDATNFTDGRDDYGTLLLDRRGRIWLSTNDRLGIYENAHLRELQPSVSPGPAKMGFAEDHTGEVWVFGSRGVGRVEGSTVRFLSEHQGVAAGRVFGATFDDDGGWWLATPEGVMRASASDMTRAFADSSYVPRPRLFGAADGMPGNVSIEGHVLAPSVDGTLWIATDSGVGHLDPRHLPDERTPTPIIEAVRVDGRETAPGEVAALAPRSGDLEVDYTVTEFSSPERIQFRYQLDGADPVWHEVGTRRRAYFTNLSPGTYHFRVAARRGNGDWSETSSAWSFHVLPAWYQTWWFRTVAILAIGAFFAAIATLIQRRRHLAAQAALEGKFEATLAERARIAQDLHDSLLQGFVGVTLQLKAAERALPPHSEAAAEKLAAVQRLARDSLREARERVWDLRDSELQADDIAAALESLARERAAETDIAISLIVSGERRRLPRDVENAAFRIGREVIANALRHASAKHIEIEATFAERAFRLDVRDDGKGFTQEEGDEARRQGHFGLSGVKERATMMGGRCEIQRRDGGGTVIAIELPLVVSMTIDGVA